MGSRPTQHIETELKFEVSGDFVLPDLGSLPGGVAVTDPEVFLLVASYFDTADLRLAKASITLRRRTGGSDAGWHLKLPVTAGTRRELQVPLGDDATAVPAQLTSLVSTWVRDEPLQVVAVLETRRTVRRLAGRGGETLAEVADDAVTGRVPGSGDVAAEPATWREIEIELVGGGPEILAAAQARMTAAGARPSSAASKLGRLLGARAAASEGGRGARSGP
jgi:inorganic triphosphatase YgiF